MILRPKVRVLLAALAATAIAACAVDQGTEQPLGGVTGHVALQPLCTGADDENACWLAVDGKPGCHIWIPEPWGEQSVAFEGSANCTNGKLTGDGNVTWRTRIDGEWESTAGEGRFVEGEMHGHWVLDFPDGSREEGPYVDSERHGKWVFTKADGTRLEGPYVDGRKQGQWVTTYENGRRQTVNY